VAAAQVALVAPLPEVSKAKRGQTHYCPVRDSLELGRTQ
jgi:hypothetical protein